MSRRSGADHHCTAGGRGRSGPRQIREADQPGVRRDEGEPGTAPEGARARERAPEAADSAGRAHEGVPGDRGGSQDPLARRARGAGRSVRPTRASRVSEVGQRTGSSPRSSCGGGWGGWASRRSLSSRAARGRTATTRASTASSGTSCWNGEIFYSLAQAAVLVEQWRREYNTVRPHSACGGFPPAPEAIKPSPWFLRMPVLHGPPQVLGLT